LSCGAPADIGGLVRALISLADEAGGMDWTNQVYFLRSGTLMRPTIAN